MPPTDPQVSPANPSQRILKSAGKVLLALVFIIIGFVLGTYAAMLSDQRESQQATAAFPATYYGVNALQYSGGTLLYVWDKDAQHCGDSPNALCKGSLYEIADGSMKQVATNVMGDKLLYYEPGVRALLQSGFGDGSCRMTKF